MALIVFLASLLLLASTASGQSKSATTKRSAAKLQLTAGIVEQRSCSADEFVLKLRLTFRNLGDRPVILHKQTAISRIMVSATLTDANEKRYEQELRYDDPGADTGLNQPSMSDFTIIPTGTAFQFDSTISIYLSNEARIGQRLLNAGSHFLQVETGTWPYVTEPIAFREKWKDQGDLFFAGLTSQPLPFTIEKNIQIVKCK